MVDVVRMRDVERLEKRRQELERIRSTTYTLGGADLLRARAAIGDALNYLVQKDAAGAALNLQPTRPSPLTIRIRDTCSRLDAVLFPEIRLGKPKAVPKLAEEKSSEKSQERTETTEPEKDKAQEKQGEEK